MTDKELLELAAKAAGISLEWDGEPKDWLPMYYKGKTYHIFNPLEDDCDALRLESKLRLEIEHGSLLDNNLYVRVFRSGIEIVCDPTSVIEEFEDESGRISATRRAITRAAAEIGKSMKAKP